MYKKIQRGLSVVLTVLILVVLGFSLKLFWPAMHRSQEVEAEYNRLREESDRKTAECIELNREVHDLEHSPEAIEKVARERFNFCREGEVILRYDK